MSMCDLFCAQCDVFSAVFSAKAKCGKHPSAVMVLLPIISYVAVVLKRIILGTLVRTSSNSYHVQVHRNRREKRREC
jgi:hypothetical protein